MAKVRIKLRSQAALSACFRHGGVMRDRRAPRPLDARRERLAFGDDDDHDAAAQAVVAPLCDDGGTNMTTRPRDVRRIPWGDRGGLTLELLRGTELPQPRARTLALDGAYRGFRVEHDLDFVSLDQHDGCVRFQARSTCEQVREALRLHPTFTSRFDTLVVNDLDGDTLLSLYMLHPARTQLVLEPDRDVRGERLVSLVDAVGLTDALGPQLTSRLPAKQRGFADAFYRALSQDVGLTAFTSVRHFDRWPAWLEASLTAIDTVLERDDHVALPRGAYAQAQELVRGERFVIAEANESSAMAMLYRAGHEVVVISTPERAGRRTYTIGKPSDLGRGNVRAAIDALNAREPGWGGGSSIGGSPRNGGSALTPGEVAEILRSVL